VTTMTLTPAPDVGAVRAEAAAHYEWLDGALADGGGRLRPEDQLPARERCRRLAELEAEYLAIDPADPIRRRAYRLAVAELDERDRKVDRDYARTLELLDRPNLSPAAVARLERRRRELVELLDRRRRPRDLLGREVDYCTLDGWEAWAQAHRAATGYEPSWPRPTLVEWRRQGEWANGRRP
jgi:hypothetical protein